MNAPVAPWALTGESIVTLARCSPAPSELPQGLASVAGPILIVANRYTDSPVGPYLELAVGRPARLGLRPGWCFTTMVVDRSEARLGGRLNWGFPKELGRLVWAQDGDERELRWLDRDICVRGVPSRFVLPFLLPMRSLQRRGDGPVVVPSRVRGRGRPASVTVYAPQDDPMAPAAGTHLGVHIAGLRLVVRPARQPVGRASTLLAPLRAPEPALSWRTPGD